jgi:hypothetical protein
MEFKFAIGEAVSYKPPGQNSSLYMVIRQMPEEPRSSTDLRYRIKSGREEFERIVVERDLRLAVDLVSNEASRLFRKV